MDHENAERYCKNEIFEREGFLDGLYNAGKVEGQMVLIRSPELINRPNYYIPFDLIADTEKRYILNA